MKSVSNFTKNNFPVVWSLFFTTVQRCLSCRTTGLDAGSMYIFHLMYGIVFEDTIDFDTLMWKDFIARIPAILSSKRKKEVLVSIDLGIL